MSNNIGENYRSRIGSVSELENLADGIDIEGKRKAKTMFMKVPQEISAEKRKEKKAKKKTYRKWLPNAEGRYQCPFCVKTFENPASASNHVWYYHQEEKLKTALAGLKKQDETNLLNEETETDLFECLKSLPSDVLEAIDSEKLKQLIKDYNYRKQRGKR